MEIAFTEFVSARCEEIVTNDKGLQSKNISVYELECALKSTLSGDQLKLFIAYERALVNYEMIKGNILYRQGFADRIELK